MLGKGSHPFKCSSFSFAATMKFDRKKFFDGFRDKIDSTISQEQVEGLEFLLGKIEHDILWRSIPEIAYALATAGHETAWSFQPVEEGYYLGKKAKAFQKSLRYYPYYGRGYVQLTWRKNYEKAEKILGLPLVSKPELALDREGAYLTMTYGMHEGWFTGKKLSDYISDTGKDYKNARKIINGLDKAGLIAGYANQFEDILRASKLAAVPQSTPTEVIPVEESLVPADTPPPAPEIKTTEVAQAGGTTTAVETTVPAGDPPEAAPVQVSQNGPLAKWIAGGGGLTAIGGLVWGFIQSNLNAIAIGIICLTLLIIVIIFRGAITDAIRMQVAADPNKKNVS